MGLIGGVLGALLISAIVVPLSGNATANLAPGTGVPVRIALVLAGALCGYLGGSAVLRRARRSRAHLPLFAGLAWGLAAGLVGAITALLLTAAYVSAYSGWPQDTLDRILFVLSFPAVAALGFLSLGALGLVAGLIAGAALKLAYLGR